MNKQDFFRNLHASFKNRFVMSEYLNPNNVQEYACEFRMTISANKTEAKLEDILIYIRGINGVTIVRSSETTKRDTNNRYSTKIDIKYTPQTFNRGITLEEVYSFLESEIRKFSSAISLTRISSPPGTLVIKGSS